MLTTLLDAIIVDTTFANNSETMVATMLHRRDQAGGFRSCQKTKNYGDCWCGRTTGNFLEDLIGSSDSYSSEDDSSEEFAGDHYRDAASTRRKAFVLRQSARDTSPIWNCRTAVRRSSLPNATPWAAPTRQEQKNLWRNDSNHSNHSNDLISGGSLHRSSPRRSLTRAASNHDFSLSCGGSSHSRPSPRHSAQTIHASKSIAFCRSSSRRTLVTPSTNNLESQSSTGTSTTSKPKRSRRRLSIRCS